jgi:hypothetical protein
MDANAAVLADASFLLQQDLYSHLEEAEYLSDIDWTTEEQHELVRDLLSELPMLIRHTLAPHRANEQGDCTACERPWPCQVVTTLHSLVKHPDNHFAKLTPQPHPR